jgi:hypothetical protein
MLHCKAHLQLTLFSVQIRSCKRALQFLPPLWLDHRLDDKVLIYQDGFNINPTYNTDGLINCLLQPGLLHNQPLKSMQANSFQLIKFCCTRTVPATKTKSIGLQADAQVVMVFARHFDSFILTLKILPTYRDQAIWTVSSWHETLVHLSGLCKNSCQPGHGRQLIKPPGRYM